MKRSLLGMFKFMTGEINQFCSYLRTLKMLIINIIFHKCGMKCLPGEHLSLKTRTTNLVLDKTKSNGMSREPFLNQIAYSLSLKFLTVATGVGFTVFMFVFAMFSVVIQRARAIIPTIGIVTHA